MIDKKTEGIWEHYRGEYTQLLGMCTALQAIIDESLIKLEYLHKRMKEIESLKEQQK